MNPQIAKPTFDENSTLPYLGKNYPLKILTQEFHSWCSSEIHARLSIQYPNL